MLQSNTAAAEAPIDHPSGRTSCKSPETIRLTPEAYAAFIAVCNNPPEPSQALKDLVREYGRFAK